MLLFAVSALVVVVGGAALLVRGLVPTRPEPTRPSAPRAPVTATVDSGADAQATMDAPPPPPLDARAPPAARVAHVGSCLRPTDCKDPMSVCERGLCICVDGARVCDGVCRDLRVDPQHCGACNKKCAPSATCNTDFQGSRCIECGSEPNRSDGRRRLCGWHNCVPIDYDHENCGDCGVRCPADSVCHGGICVPTK